MYILNFRHLDGTQEVRTSAEYLPNTTR